MGAEVNRRKTCYSTWLGLPMKALDSKCGHRLDMDGIRALAGTKDLLLLSDIADSAGTNRKAMAVCTPVSSPECLHAVALISGCSIGRRLEAK